MQLQITFTSSASITLPFAHQYALQSMIYDALGGDYAVFLHDIGYSSGDRAMKLFTFGRLHGKYIVRNGMLLFTPPITWELRSPEDEFSQMAAVGFIAGSTHCLCGQMLEVTSCEVCSRVIRGDALDIAMDSPVTVYRTSADGSTRYFAPDEPEFAELIVVNAARKWFARYGWEMPGTLHIVPLRVREHDKVVTRYKDFFITAWMGQYRLEAPSPVLDLLFQAGLGAKSAQGFGLFH